MEKTNQLEKTILEMHPSEGKSRDDGGNFFVDEIVLCGEEAAVYSLDSNNWNPYGGSCNSGITKWQGINAYDGNTEIEVKPMAMWRDGENQYNDRPENNYYIQKFEKIRKGIYELDLINGNGKKETYEIDFNKKESRYKK